MPKRHITAEELTSMRSTLDSAMQFKEAGNAALRAGDVDKAIKEYHNVSLDLGLRSQRRAARSSRPQLTRALSGYTAQSTCVSVRKAEAKRPRMRRAVKAALLRKRYKSYDLLCRP